MIGNGVGTGVKAAGVEHVRHERLSIRHALVTWCRAAQAGRTDVELVRAAIAVVVDAIALLGGRCHAAFARSPVRELLADAALDAAVADADVAASSRPREAAASGAGC